MDLYQLYKFGRQDYDKLVKDIADNEGVDPMLEVQIPRYYLCVLGSIVCIIGRFKVLRSNAED
jgi:hypothetical protein